MKNKLEKALNKLSSAIGRVDDPPVEPGGGDCRDANGNPIACPPDPRLRKNGGICCERWPLADGTFDYTCTFYADIKEGNKDCGGGRGREFARFIPHQTCNLDPGNPYETGYNCPVVWDPSPWDLR